jgi:acetyl esterase/lipase
VAYRIRGTGIYHPELRSAARLLPRRATGPVFEPVRRRLESLVSQRGDERTVEISPTATVRVHRPADLPTPAPALLWIHGGGLVMGSAKQDDRACAAFAAEVGAVVAAVDYRLASQAVFPAALDDCYDALTWLHGNPDVDPERLAIGGGSAGAGLAAALAQLVRDRGEIKPRLQLLVYPMLDDRTAARPDPDGDKRRLWDNTANRVGWSAYLGRPAGSADVSPLASPARAVDLSELAAAWIGVGSLDLFRDECVDYAERLRAAGVDCTLKVVDGAFHGFDYIAPRAEVTRDFHASQVDALRAALQG